MFVYPKVGTILQYQPSNGGWAREVLVTQVAFSECSTQVWLSDGTHYRNFETKPLEDRDIDIPDGTVSLNDKHIHLQNWWPPKGYTVIK